MTFVQTGINLFDVKSYFIDGFDPYNKQKQMGGLCYKLEKFMAERCPYSPEVATIQMVFFCGRFFRARLRPKYIEGKVAKCQNARILDLYISHELQIDIDLNEYCEEFFKADKKGSQNIIANKTLEYVSTIPFPSKISKTFDRKRFVSDLREFFESIGCEIKTAEPGGNE